MAKTKVSEWSATPANNTDVGGIDINEGCAPSGINNAIRDMMAQIKDMQTGADGDDFVVGGNLTVTGTTTLSTDLPIVSGGTGASTAANARTNLGLGTISTQAANNVTITGGSITGITDLAVADGGTGASTLTANAVLLGNGTSTLQTVAPGTSGNVLTSNGTTWTSAPASTLTQDTAKASTSGTSIDFTGIPSSVKRITVMFNGVSTNGTSIILIQLGNSGGIETTGYVGAASYLDNAGSADTVSYTNGIALSSINTAASTWNGLITICNVNANIWAANGTTANPQIPRTNPTASSKTLSDVLDRIRITTANGTDTFDAGSINILYE